MKKYTQPVKVGDEVDIEVENIGEKGDGVARYKKFVIIVPNGEIEKKYKVKIKKVFNTWALSEIIGGK